jgi:O-acetyl-ADP-ribose deacetylase (regulator of RNase III)
MKEIKGDLIQLYLDGYFDVIAHGANCRNIMGAGIAKHIKNRIPGVFVVDTNFSKTGWRRAGDFSVYEDNGKFVYNLYTQIDPGKNFDERYLLSALSKMRVDIIEKDPKMRIGLPMIGCGIGGGNWNNVKKTIESVMFGLDVTIVYYV